MSADRSAAHAHDARSDWGTLPVRAWSLRTAHWSRPRHVCCCGMLLPNLMLLTRVSTSVVVHVRDLYVNAYIYLLALSYDNPSSTSNFHTSMMLHSCYIVRVTPLFLSNAVLYLAHRPVVWLSRRCHDSKHFHFTTIQSLCSMAPHISARLLISTVTYLWWCATGHGQGLLLSSHAHR